MAKEDFIPVSGDDWYERRRQDAVGTFFRKVADQGPRKGTGGTTRQGIYCLTADGQLLAYKNAGQNADVMREVLRQGLAAWNRLPAQRRRPGALTVGDRGQVDARYTRALPPGACVVHVYTRILDHDDQGALCKGTCATLGGDRAARDHLWVTAADVKALAPADGKVGDRLPLPPALAERIARFHLIDNTRGEPPLWTRDQLRTSELTLTIIATTSERLHLRLDGSVLLSSDADTRTANRGFDVRLLGYVGYDRQKQILDRFDLVAVGDCWGEGTYTRGARQGRQPLGVAFELAQSDDVAATLVPPQAARDIGNYLRPGR
jgi:hypothetical protein